MAKGETQRVMTAAMLAALAGAGLPARAGPFPASIPLSTLDGIAGIRVGGAVEHGYSGWAIASAGDINGDGVDDFIVGARLDGPGGLQTGSTYVVFGREAGGFPASLNLVDLDGTNGFRMDGLDTTDQSGFSVARAGDVNGDGVGDIIIGAQRADAGSLVDAGEAYVVFGRDTTTAGAFPAVVALAALNGANGFRVAGAHPNDRTGWSVAPAGDINGDGIGDVLMGARFASPNQRSRAGSTYVLFGRDAGAGATFPPVLSLSTLTAQSGFRIDGAAARDYSGTSVASVGDINGDGVDDIAVGAYSASPGGLAYAGATYVVFGKNTGQSGPFPAAIDLAFLGAAGFRVDGAAPEDESGASVAGPGDVNGDGIADLVIGALYASPGGRLGAGSTFVLFGRNGGAGAFPAVLSLAGLNGATGFRIDGVGAGDFCGISVAIAGDINGDGASDVLIGAPYANPGGRPHGGAAYVVFGRNTALVGAFAPVIALASLDGVSGFRLEGGATNDDAGRCVAGAGDVNGDGVDDLLVGAYRAAWQGLPTAGVTYVVYGRGLPACAGDTNGDGVVDFIDLNRVLSSFGAGVGDPAFIPGADLDGDDDVDFIDLNIVLSFFGTAC